MESDRGLSPVRRVLFCLQIKSKISYCIVIGNSFDNLFQTLHVFWIFSVFNPSSDQFAEYSSKVLMSRIRKEASGICQHSYKVSKQTKICQRCHLFHHTGLVIVEPPCRSLLNLTDCIGILETSQNSSQCLIIIWIQAVENGLRKIACFIHQSVWLI